MSVAFRRGRFLELSEADTDEFVHERDEAVEVLLGRKEEVVLPVLLD